MRERWEQEIGGREREGGRDREGGRTEKECLISSFEAFLQLSTGSDESHPILRRGALVGSVKGTEGQFPSDGTLPRLQASRPQL